MEICIRASLDLDQRENALRYELIIDDVNDMPLCTTPIYTV